jgi:hypothetical protein
MTHLGFFFKDPIDVTRHDLFTQWTWLLARAAGQTNTQ